MLSATISNTTPKTPTRKQPVEHIERLQCTQGPQESGEAPIVRQLRPNSGEGVGAQYHLSLRRQDMKTTHSVGSSNSIGLECLRLGVDVYPLDAFRGVESLVVLHLSTAKEGTLHHKTWWFCRRLPRRGLLTTYRF